MREVAGPLPSLGLLETVSLALVPRGCAACVPSLVWGLLPVVQIPAASRSNGALLG